MLADTDIAARFIWLRNGAYCAPRIEVATRWTFSVNACAFRQTRNFLKSLMLKNGNGQRRSRPRFHATSSFSSQGLNCNYAAARFAPIAELPLFAENVETGGLANQGTINGLWHRAIGWPQKGQVNCPVALAKSVVS